MFFEDEKDKDIIIDSDADLQISDDGTVSWDDILVESDDDLVSVKETAPQPSGIKGDILIDDEEDVPAHAEPVKEDIADNIDYSDVDDDDEDDVDDAELQKILANDSSNSYQSSDAGASNENIEDASGDFDIDAQLENAVNSGQQRVLKDRTPRKDIKIASSNHKSNTPFLLAILVAVLVGAGFYYYSSYSSSNEEELLAKQEMTNQVQEQLDSATQQDIENRTQDDAQQAQESADIPVVNEEDVNEVQPVKEDKKEVVPLIQTGRIDPFLPLGKYTQVAVAEKKVQPIAIPQKSTKIVTNLNLPPKTISTIPSVPMDMLDKLTDFHVSGILYDSKNASAIVTYKSNSFFVKKGDYISTLLVSDITKDSVVLSSGKYSFKVPVAVTDGPGFYFDGMTSPDGKVRYYTTLAGNDRPSGSYSGDRGFSSHRENGDNNRNNNRDFGRDNHGGDHGPGNGPDNGPRGDRGPDDRGGPDNRGHDSYVSGDDIRVYERHD